MHQPTIAACIIARNEERVLRRCLRSIQKVCNEICVLDTGSKDRTMAIAVEAGAKVGRFTQCNDHRGRIADFAAARNSALAMAQAEWILWIDADEILSRGSLKHLRSTVKRRDATAVATTVSSGNARWCTVRLFRRLPGAQFRGIVHEWIDVDGPELTEPRIVIRNKPDKEGKESSVDRDLRLCALALAKNPRDSRMLLYRARALHTSGQYLEAMRCYKAYLHYERSFCEGRHWATQNIAACHLLIGSWKAALNWGRKALRLDDTRAESYCVVGDALLALGRCAGARSAYTTALRCPLPRRESAMFVDLSYYTMWPRQRLRRFFGHR